MILYNVTLNVSNTIREEWFNWMLEEHIPEVLQTGLFVDYKFLKLLNEKGENPEDTTYAVQYFLKDIQDFLLYADKYAPILQEKTKQKYGEQVLVFRTLLEVLNKK